MKLIAYRVARLTLDIQEVVEKLSNQIPSEEDRHHLVAEIVEVIAWNMSDSVYTEDRKTPTMES